MVIKKKAINSTFALKIKIRDPNPTREGREEKKPYLGQEPQDWEQNEEFPVSETQKEDLVRNWNPLNKQFMCKAYIGKAESENGSQVHPHANRTLTTHHRKKGVG